MKPLEEQSAKVSRVLASAFPDRMKRNLAAQAAAIQPGTLVKKISGSPVERRDTKVPELMAWVQADLVTDDHLTELFVGIGKRVSSLSSTVPVRNVAAYVAHALTEILDATQDGLLEPKEKAPLKHRSLTAIKALESLANHCAETAKEITRV